MVESSLKRRSQLCILYSCTCQGNATERPRVCPQHVLQQQEIQTNSSSFIILPRVAAGKAACMQQLSASCLPHHYTRATVTFLQWPQCSRGSSRAYLQDARDGSVVQVGELQHGVDGNAAGFLLLESDLGRRAVEPHAHLQRRHQCVGEAAQEGDEAGREW